MITEEFLISTLAVVIKYMLPEQRRKFFKEFNREMIDKFREISIEEAERITDAIVVLINSTPPPNGIKHPDYVLAKALLEVAIQASSYTNEITELFTSSDGSQENMTDVQKFNFVLSFTSFVYNLQDIATQAVFDAFYSHEVKDKLLASITVPDDIEEDQRVLLFSSN